jgi:hypothetical protein
MAAFHPILPILKPKMDGRYGTREAVLAAKTERPVSASKAVLCRQ